MATEDDPSALLVDEVYEFSAPRFYDFVHGESEEDARKAELWFETALSYGPSPFMQRIKSGRSVKLDSICDFSEANEMPKAQESTNSATASSYTTANETLVAKEQTSDLCETRPPTEPIKPKPVLLQEEVTPDGEANLGSGDKQSAVHGSVSAVISLSSQGSCKKLSSLQGACTPQPPKITSQKAAQQTDAKKHQTAKKIASMIRNPSALKSKTQSQVKTINPASARRNTNMKIISETPNFAQENQAIKRQKLEEGKARQILSIKPQTLLHKTRPGKSTSNLYTSTAKTRTEDRKIYVREPAAPFISMAEMMKKFESSTREMSMPRMNCSMSHDGMAGSVQRKPKLTLTRPKEPELETAQRYRPVKLKSSAELEEEMMAKIPKFKARPLNKKIFEAPGVPPLPKSTPQPPEFKEFHLETMARANQNAETSTVASVESNQCHPWRPHLTAPKSPTLQTLLRARPPKIKSSEELEKEELEKLPKFKARPLNKKIFESKGDVGIFCNTKKQVTVPQEFHFATDERIPPPPPTNVADIFDKLSLNSEPQNDKYVPRNTAPNPFHLHTEERGAEKERRLFMELLNKQIEEERARVPKATPYPYTTDYPVVPPKPEPKQCTKPEPFQLESLTRHEQEMQKEMEERQRLEKEEAMMRVFKAQPVLKEDPIPVPEKARKPLTEVQEFNLHVEHRAVDRAKFDEKIKEKEMMYKRYREEAETEKMMEEEKALKQLRRTLVPHARPVPKFDQPFLPQKSSKQVTRAKSPRLQLIKRKERRKLCPFASAGASATSSTASQMR
ncbi:PREDICTED: protein TPX2 isoform X2 [Ipomoea nil]|uniref:protein TPX2 isoform X2 n=1 Tax=Ipomoea nil TaxID=35883 RepID=UPI000900A027|nr:PREDICTED: protein TPX2 isoform X2 [Ipomoea nil]